jgi:hypothetical protein
MIDLLGSKLRREELDVQRALRRELAALRAVLCDAEDERLLALKLARDGEKSVVKHAALPCASDCCFQKTWSVLLAFSRVDRWASPSAARSHQGAGAHPRAGRAAQSLRTADRLI